MYKLTFSALLAFVLTACGGGGGDSEPASPAASTAAEGFWQGASSTGYNVSLALLENGETWGVYSSGNTVVGALYGNTTSSGNSLSGAGRDFNVPSRTVTAGTYSGTFAPKSTISVTTSTGVRFNGSYQSAYDQPASLAAVAGTFRGTGVTGTSPVQSVSVTVAASGAVTVPPSLGCGATGTATPRGSGKNVFNVTVTFSGSTCALGNGATATGVAYYDTTTRRLVTLAMNSAKSDGFIYVGQN